MLDPLAALVVARGLGSIERRVLLRGRFSLPDGSEVAPALVLTADGAYLAGARDAEHGEIVALRDRGDVRVEAGRLQTTLRVGEQTFSVLAPRSPSFVELLALGRLRGAGASRVPRPLPAARHVDRLSELEALWLDTWLDPDETVLACLSSASTAIVASPIADSIAAELHLVLTDRRLACWAMTPLGDVLVEPLDPATLTVTRVKGHLTITAGMRVLESSRAHTDHFAEVAAAAALRGTARIRDIARYNYLGRAPDHLPQCRALLSLAHRRGDALAPFIEFWIGEELGEPPLARPSLENALDRLRADEAGSDAFADAHATWQFSSAAGRALLAQLRPLGDAAEPWSLTFHAYLHENAPRSRPDLASQALATLDLVEHSLKVDDRSRAIELLETRIDALPSEAISDVALPADVDLTTGAGGQTLRTRAFELLAQAKGEPDLRSAAELARLHPLVVARVRDLVAVAAGDLKRRAERVVELLEPGGLAEPPEPRPWLPVRPLSDRAMNDGVRHPSSREGSPVLGRIQALLANVPVPDLGMLRDYCEKLGDGRHREAARALSDACIAFGVPGIQGYVSQGVKGVGVRAYESEPPFVLVGGQHLSSTEYELAEAELRFALGAEVAHLRFGHSRVTSSEVWAGTLEKGKQGLDFALTVLPIMKGWDIAEKAVRATNKMKIPLVRRVLGATRNLRDRTTLPPSLRPRPEDNADVLSLMNEQLVFTHRAMQLTADRAGLVLSGDPRAAIRALMLVRRDYATELKRAKELGLTRVLGLRAEDGVIAYQDLAIRIASLLSFYLSDEYPKLRSALTE